jgi:hypothetical protein
VRTPPSDSSRESDKSNKKDLTSTLNIASLRSVPDFISEKTLLDSLSSE